MTATATAGVNPIGAAATAIATRTVAVIAAEVVTATAAGIAA